jgi:hypothetical protein
MKAQENVLPLDSPGRLVRTARNVGTFLFDEGMISCDE